MEGLTVTVIVREGYWIKNGPFPPPEKRERGGFLGAGWGKVGAVPETRVGRRDQERVVGCSRASKILEEWRTTEGGNFMGVGPEGKSRWIQEKDGRLFVVLSTWRASELSGKNVEMAGRINRPIYIFLFGLESNYSRQMGSEKFIIRQDLVL